MMRLSASGKSVSEIQRLLKQNNVRKYLSGEKKHYLSTIRWHHDRLGRPEQGFKWLPMHLQPRGVPVGPWVSVPDKIRTFQDVVHVVEQLRPTPQSFQMMQEFGFHTSEELLANRTNLLAFFAGAVLGDAGKQPKGEFRFPSKSISLELSKNRQNSFRFEQYTSLSVNASLGSEMHRIRDSPSSDQRFTQAECYHWITPASPLYAWTFRVLLGLNEGETTTKNPVRMDWLLDAPREFKVHFLQGLCESDGWVNAGMDKVIFVSSPNEKMLTDLLASLGVKSRYYWQPGQKGLVTVMHVDTEVALLLPIFSERINSNNYTELVTMATAQRFPERRALPDWFIEKIRPILAKPTKHTKACLEIARTTGYKISDDTVKTYRKQLFQ